jgi:GNAT superfamily N-acetyltransferase
VTVIDDWQAKGVGTLLFEVLAGRARTEGIRTFTALMLASNQAMMDVLKALGPVRIIDQEAGTVEVEMPIPVTGLSPALRKLLRVSARMVERQAFQVAAQERRPLRAGAQGASDARVRQRAHRLDY